MALNEKHLWIRLGDMAFFSYLRTMNNKGTHTTNPELELAWQFIERTGVNVFLTGKAGTGKTTFLRQLRERSPKRMVVVAPTGVAAINAGGVTIHSFSSFLWRPTYRAACSTRRMRNTASARRKRTSYARWICW